MLNKYETPKSSFLDKKVTSYGVRKPLPKVQKSIKITFLSLSPIIHFAVAKLFFKINNVIFAVKI